MWLTSECPRWHLQTRGGIGDKHEGEWKTTTKDTSLVLGFTILDGGRTDFRPRRPSQVRVVAEQREHPYVSGALILKLPQAVAPDNGDGLARARTLSFSVVLICPEMKQKMAYLSVTVYLRCSTTYRQGGGVKANETFLVLRVSSR